MSFNPTTFNPPVLSVGAGTSQNGRQSLGNGLVTHRGIIDANSIRAQGRLYPQSGAGVEVQYDQPGKSGFLISYDRDAGAYTDLNIGGQNINLNPHTPGRVNLPAGTATSQLGLYRAVAAYYVPAANAWYESNAQGSVTTSGGRIRATACGALYSAQAGTQVYAGFMTDGAVTYDSLTACAIAASGYCIPFAYTCYSQPAAGLHRFAICIYANTANNSGLWGGGYTNLWIHEELA